MKKLTDITFTSTGGGVYAVYLDGTFVSNHNALHKAIEVATNLIIEHPDSDVEIRQVLKIKGNGRFKDVQQHDPVDPDPVDPDPIEPEDPREPDPDPDPDGEYEYGQASETRSFTTQ